MVKQPNVSPHYEIYEVQWDRQHIPAGEEPIILVTRLRNMLQKKNIHVASSKGQISEQLKPLRLKHGKPNPAKALKLKFSIPLQFLYLTLEDGHELVERTEIYPDFTSFQKTKNTALDKQELSRSNTKVSFKDLKKEAAAEKTSKKAMDATVTTQRAFGSPSKSGTIVNEKQHALQISEELLQQVKAACHLI